jgi:hypothetical protein
VSEFSDLYAKMGALDRKQARKSLEVEMARTLTEFYGRVWSKGKIAVRASKMVDESLHSYPNGCPVLSEGPQKDDL